MRILQVFASGTIGTDHAGPVSTVITHLANGYAAAGHHVTVVDAPATAGRRRLRPGIVVRELAPRSAWMNRVASVTALMTAFVGYASAWARGRNVRALVAREGFDAIHVHDSADALAIGALCKTPVLWTAHNLNWTLEAHRRVSLAAWLGRHVDRAACARVSRVVVLNRQTRDALPNRNVTWIPNGADLAGAPHVDRAVARAQLHIPLDEFRVTYLGRVAPEKGTDVFVHAVQAARREIAVTADAIGSLSGKYGTSPTVTRFADAVRASAPDISFHGFIARDSLEFRLRLAAADAVIVPSITEPFGLVVLDALACGAWVIGSNNGGIADILDARTGDLVPPGDADALARAIVAHQRRALDGAVALRARARANEFHWSNTVEQYLRALREIIWPNAIVDIDRPVAMPRVDPDPPRKRAARAVVAPCVTTQAPATRH